MSDLRRILTATINADTGERVSLPDGATAFQAAEDRIVMWRGTQNIYRVELFRDDTTTTFKPPAGTVWYFGIDNVFTPDHADLVETLDADFNLVADWSAKDPENGKVCWRMDLTTDALKTAMGTYPSLPMWACLWMTPPNEPITMLCQWPITMNNIAVEPD